MYFRAASCTGALYEFELYLVCGDLPGLKAGVYHFGPGDYALRLLREGDYRGVLQQQAPAVIVCAGTYWRNAWKYRERTYRHFGWDNGTMLANMLAMTAALRLPSKVVFQFVDSDVNALLDLDTQREVAFSMVTIGSTEQKIPPRRDTPPLGLPTVPLSQTEIDYPAIRAMHEASSLTSLSELDQSDSGFNPRHPFNPRPDSPSDPIEQVILRRGSSRAFERVPMTQAQLQTILDSATCGIPADFPPMNDLYLIVNAVDGLNPGAYFYERETGKLECLKEGDFRNRARYLGLGQDLPGDAAADVFFLADLNPILERYGNRGYRAVQLEAGILGGKLYLAAYAQRLGATGLTFFDDDVIDFFEAHARGKSAIFLVALGKGRKVR